MAQPGKEIMNGGDDERSAVAVLHVGGMHFGSDQLAGCVGDDMTFAAVDFLRPIETARAAGLGGLDRLAIDDARRWARLASGASRACSNSSKLIRSNTRLSRQA